MTTTVANFPACVSAFEEELDFIFRALRRHGVLGADAEDLAQDVFLVMWRRWTDYDAGRPLRPWIMGITFRVAHQHRRRKQREVPSGFVDLEDQTLRADDHVAVGRARALVREALASLPEKQRALMILHELDGLAMAEIAETMSVPITTLYSRLTSARRAFARAVRRLERAPELARARGFAAAPAVAGLLELERLPDPPPPEVRARILRRARAVAAAPVALTRGAGPSPRPRIPFAVELGACAVAVLGLMASLLWHGLPARPARGPEALAAPAAGERPRLPATLVAMAPRRAATFVAPPAGGERPAEAQLGQGLVGYWRFDDGYGSPAARDLSGNGTDCLLRRLDPTADWVDGRLGGALNLTGRGWLECADPRFGRGADLTVAAWVKRPRAQRGMRVLATRQLGGTEKDHFFFGFIDDQLSVSSHVWNGPLRHPLPGSIDRWSHVAAVHRDGQVTLFVDGVEVAQRRSYRGRMVDTAAALIVGAGVNGPDPAVTTQRFQGVIDELLVYSRPLAGEEIAALAAGAQPRLSP